MAEEVKCTFLGNCECPSCVAKRAAAPASPRTSLGGMMVIQEEDKQDDSGFIPVAHRVFLLTPQMKSSDQCTYLINCSCETCKTILNPLDEYISTFMERRPLMECTGLVNCICVKVSSAGAFSLEVR